MPRGIVARGVLVALLLATSHAMAQEARPILGFSNLHVARERPLESRFLALPSAKEARRWHREFTRQPHPAGSAENTRLADYIAQQWRSQGWEDVVLRRYDVLHSTPRSVSLEMVAPVPYRAGLREDAYAADPDTRNPAAAGAYFGYSASGDVTADLVYAHSGNPEDYALLKSRGISVRGKVVLVRYSNPYSYRGFKALTAEREGAAALLIYSDPKDDGYARGKVFPQGPWGPEGHIQHGAITYDFIVPGDPTTPGWPSVPGARHIANDDAQSLPKIIALPLSWRDARPLLEHLDGPAAPPEWQGALPFTYRLGGAVKVHVHADMDTSVKPYTVVEARIRGAEKPDEWVLLGNHRDAWVYGGVDPVSGTAAMMELTRSLGELKKQGLRPRRTLVVCSWDGEEYGLTGSTEWGEQFADELQQKLVAYLNVDEAVAGAATTAGPEGLKFDVSAVASLSPMLVEASHDVRAPSGKSLYEAWRTTTTRDTGNAADDGTLVDPRIGSGSDHTVFLNHLGRPVVNLGFTGQYGVYHSIYDDHFWMDRIGDPGYAYHVALTQVWGLATLRLANADVLPFDFKANAEALHAFVDELVMHNRALPEQVDLLPLRHAIDEFAAAGSTLADRTRGVLPASGKDADFDALNRSIMQVEGNWLAPEGIPGRPWFKHLLYAARYTYAHLEYPGLTEAVEREDWTAANHERDRIIEALARNTALLSKAALSL